MIVLLLFLTSLAWYACSTHFPFSGKLLQKTPARRSLQIFGFFCLAGSLGLGYQRWDAFTASVYVIFAFTFMTSTLIILLPILKKYTQTNT
ncbi:MAG: hypothetical protein AAF740_03690 [Bacteroidota bacterium]